ncbi:hypothetical protein LTR36_003739 [Oleoguttula mirabilis]|uniref:F-box protein n=1 Tax=Oleoguttula mirabilis TaxID=1507867 RepID=A0AAV9JJY2_9PEZI|nr:hypothetical protein LTR36_003739 [Oleoguttula mirabilis]
MATTASAVDTVFCTTELLEGILLHTEPNTVLSSRQVNENFRLAIQRSSPIQHLLFKALAPERSIALDGWGSCLTVCNCRSSRHCWDNIVVTCELTQPLWEKSNSGTGPAAAVLTRHTLPRYDTPYLRGSWEDLRLTPADGRSVKVKFERAWMPVLGAHTKISELVWEEEISVDRTLGQVVGAILTRQRPVERSVE